MTVTKQDAAREMLKRREARSSLLSFAEYTHPNWTTGAHHKLICDKLEAVERGEIKRLMIWAPPRHTKSELASKRFPAWLVGLHPDWQIISASHTAQLAIDFGAEVRDIVNSPEYSKLFPETKLHSDAQAAARWRTTQGGVYVAVGVDGAVTGRGANVLIIDDPVKGRNEAESSRMREVAWRWFVGDAYQRLMPGGAVILMMTRWHEDDLAGRMLETDDWTVLHLPAIDHEGTDNETALWPEWWPLEAMQEKREMMRKAHRMRDWQAQYQGNPRPSEGTYMLAQWFADRYDKAEDLPEHLNIYGATDPAVTEATDGREPDCSEHGVFGVDQDGMIWVLDWWSGQVTADVWIEAQHALISKHRPFCWFNEAGVIRRATEPLRKRMKIEAGLSFRQEWIASVADKAVRARAFQALAAQGKVRFPRTAWADRVVDQCVGFPNVRYDDAFDVLSLFCGAVDSAHPAMVPIKAAERHDAYEDLYDSRESGYSVI